MSKDIETPQMNIPLVDANGRLTPYGQVVMQKMATALVELQARVDALEAFHP